MEINYCMGLSSLVRFTNISDLKDGLQNPRKATRVVYRNIIGRQTTSVSDPTEYDEIQAEVMEDLFDLDEYSHTIDDMLMKARTGYINNRIQECESYLENKPYSIGGMRLGGETAYLLTRLIEPETILEIGVANGVSTTYILGALDEIESTADIRAIDKPQFEADIRSKRGSRGLSGVGGVIPDEKEAGWVAPRDKRLKHGYQYYGGDFTTILPEIVDSLPPIDLAIYDASKDSTEMRIAYETLIQSLSTDGILLSDDIEVNDVFFDVTEQYSGNTITFGGIGIFSKS